MRRRFIGPIAPFLVALALAWVACKSAAPTQGVAGRVVSVDGEATAASEGEAERPLVVGDPVKQSDRVRAAKGGEIEIRLDHNGASLRLADGASQVVAESAAWNAPKAIAGEALSGEIDDPSLSAGRSGDRESGSDPSTAVRPDSPSEGPNSEVVASRQTGGDGASGSGSSKPKENAKEDVKEEPTLALESSRPDEDKMVAAEAKEVDRDRGVGSSEASKLSPMKPGTVRASTVKPQKNRGAVRREVARRSREVGRCLLSVERPVTFRATFAIGKGGSVSKLEIKKHGLEAATLECVRRALGLAFRAELAGTSVVVDGDFKRAAE